MEYWISQNKLLEFSLISIDERWPHHLSSSTSLTFISSRPSHTVQLPCRTAKDERTQWRKQWTQAICFVIYKEHHTTSNHAVNRKLVVCSDKTAVSHHGQIGVVWCLTQSQLSLLLCVYTLQHTVEDVVVSLIWSLYGKLSEFIISQNILVYM